MVQVINKTTLELKGSVNTPDYPTEDWIHSPDLSDVDGVDKKYWKISGTDVLEMTQTEKDVVDDAEDQAKIDSDALAFCAGSFTTTERDAITSPLNGMIIYNTTDDEFNLYENGSWTTN